MISSLNRLLATAIIVLLTAVSTLAQDYRNGIRLGWDFRTQKFVTGGSYGRLKVLSDGRQAFVYDAAGVCMIRFRQAGTTSFFSAYTVAVPPSGSGYTNCELLELADGTLLYAYNERINGIGMKIKVKYSVNGGLSWINEQTLAEVRESDFVENEDLAFGRGAALLCQRVPSAWPRSEDCDDTLAEGRRERFPRVGGAES